MGASESSQVNGNRVRISDEARRDHDLKEKSTLNDEEQGMIRKWYEMKKTRARERYQGMKERTKVRYQGMKEKTKAKYEGMKEKAKEKYHHNIVAEKWHTVRDTVTNVAGKIEKIHEDIINFKDLRQYFFMGAFIGGTTGLLYGFYTAYRTHYMLRIPIATIGMGLIAGSTTALYLLIMKELNANSISE